MYASALSTSVPALSLGLIVGAAVAFAAGGIVVKETPPIDPVVQNGIASTVGAVILTTLAVVTGEPIVIPQRPETWIAMAYIVVPGTVLTFGLFIYLLRRWPASRVAYQFVLAPIVAIVAAAVVLGEPIEPPVIAGTALVIVGVWVGALRSTAAR